MIKKIGLLITCVLSLLIFTPASADNISDKEISQLTETEYENNTADEFLIPEGITWNSTIEDIKQALNVKESDFTITDEDNITTMVEIRNYVSPVIDGTCIMNFEFVYGRFAGLMIDAYIKQPLFGFKSDTASETAYTDLVNKFEDQYADRFTYTINDPEELLAFETNSADNIQDSYIVNSIRPIIKQYIENAEKDALKVWVIDSQYGIALYRAREGNSRNIIKIYYWNPYSILTTDGRPASSGLYALPEGIEWGDSYNKVLDKVQPHVIYSEESESMIYASPETDTYEEIKPDMVIYLFSDKGLSITVYALTRKPDYQSINASLSQKYGEGIVGSPDDPDINMMFNQLVESGDYRITMWLLDGAILYSGYNTQNDHVYILTMNTEVLIN